MATKRDFTTTYGFQSDKSGSGTNTLVVDSANDRVGIGTLSPPQTLSVVGDGAFYSSTNSAVVLHIGGHPTNSGSSNSASLNFRTSNTGISAYIQNSNQLLKIVGNTSGTVIDFDSYIIGAERQNDTRLRIEGTQGNVLVLNTIDSTSNTTGALQVSGGVGIVKNLFVGGQTRIGTVATRSAGLTVGFTNNTTFVSNSDVGDTVRALSLVNESSTTNAMSVLGFRINPGSGSANAMMDMKFVQTGATNTSALHYSFNHGGTFADRFTILSSGNIGVNSTGPNYRLDINGDARITSTNRLRFGGTSSASNYFIQYNSSANSLDFVAG